MEKIYKYKHGIIYVTIPDKCDRDRLRQVTEEFLKKVIDGGSNNDNGNKSRNFRKK